MIDHPSAVKTLRCSPAARRGLDHPRLNRRFLLKDALLLAESPDGVSCDLDRLQAIVGHDAGSKRGLVEDVPALFGPFLKELDRVDDIGNLADQVLSVLQVDGLREVSGIHISLIFDERFQWLSRQFTAACFDLMSPAGSFKTAWIAMHEKSRA